jgi:hypothetical protein
MFGGTLLILAVVCAGVKGLPGGAPNAACANVSPNPAEHTGPPQVTTSPYNLTFHMGSTTQYNPGEAYTLTFARTSGVFRGFLIVALNANNERVGSFSAVQGQARQACADSRGVTHTTRSNKTSVALIWTAPPVGTGTVTFRYAGVDVRAIYWANQMGPVVTESSGFVQSQNTGAIVGGVMAGVVGLGVIALAVLFLVCLLRT